MKLYKLARPDGWDFYTGKKINYRENIGKIVKCPNPDKSLGVCSSGVLHASVDPNDCFIGARIPCSAYLVEGKPVCGDKKKFGFFRLKVIEEIKDLDKLFGWKYSEASKLFNPLFKTQRVSKKHILLLKEWASVWASVRASVWASVWDSVWASVGASVWDSVWASVRDSVWDSVGDSVWDSVWASVRASVWDSVWASVGDSVGDSVWDSVWAYIGSLFPNIKKWKYIYHKEGVYPYQSAVDLWYSGFVPSFDGKIWRLHSGRKAKVVFEISKKDLIKFK